MGLEYKEYRFKIRNKHTKKVKTLVIQESYIDSLIKDKFGARLESSKDYDNIGFQIVYG